MGNDSDRQPWYRRTLRWGQTNLTELDPVRYDAAWWRDYWRRTEVQGVIVNAGGIVAYYPSADPLHHRAVHLGDRDLYGEIVSAAREDGLVVLARMDSNRADEAFYHEHPDWFCVDENGTPYRAGPRYVACISGPYYREYLPTVLREIIERSQPEGITDNSWSGLPRQHICHCPYCRRDFHAATGHRLPSRADWDDPAYRAWIDWSYHQRLTLWELNNEVTKAAGGEDCLWLGMNGGDPAGQARAFRDYREICRRTPIIMLDSQARRGRTGFEANGDSAKLIHGLLGWDALIPESTAMYDADTPTFRVGSKPEAEARLWAVEGFAGGLAPWWHHIGAYHEDRRQYRTSVPLFQWHARNEKWLVDREPVATVGVVWSQRSIDFYGRDDATARSTQPYDGFVNALIRARIPYLPVHIDDVGRDGARFETLVVPNVGALSDAQCDALREHVRGGGGLVVTGESSRYDEWGDPRVDFGLSDIMGVHATGAHHGGLRPAEASWETYDRHTYLRFRPELRAGIDGPHIDGEPGADGGRHAAVAGFDETDLVGFGGRLEVVRADPGVEAPLAWVAPFPIYPPETSWMRRASSDLPGLVVREHEGGGRVAYLAADLDRCHARHHHPDHARLLANVVRWSSRDRMPLAVDGAGAIDCHLYRRVGGDDAGTYVLHLVNLGHDPWPGPVHELVPVGPLGVALRWDGAAGPGKARLLVSEEEAPVRYEDGWAYVSVPTIADHEVVVFG